MLKLAKSFWCLVLALVLGLMPGLALAADKAVAPPGQTAWDLYVYGNGHVIYDILMGIKMLMIPTAGNTGFTSLLLVLATIGFVVLAIAAGFDPGKNLMRMFTYILVVWMVTFGTTKLTANVVIHDLAADPASVTGPDYVDGAPALVVLPAALTSIIGKYFTTSIETYYSIPDEFKVGGPGAGQFNLFGKMMSESNEFVITSGPLKNSLSAYAANCVVPGLALGKVEGQVKNPSGPGTVTAYGLDALLHGVNMMDVLGTAKSKSLLTRYYAYDATDTSWTTKAGTELSGIPTDPDSLRSYMARGVLVSCDSAHTIIKADMESHAQQMLDSSSKAWAKTGVMVPYEVMMQQMLASASGRGGEAVANFSSPSGFTMQRALVNASNGVYRQAAAQTGNNEMVQAAALTQAEVSQKSAWAASFAVFNNMMGYVFTVLQAFIFAITPLIIVALFVPGMGKAIFVNYAQILVWLTLWQPMLSIINFVITLFGADAVSNVVTGSGGVTMANQGAISSKTNDLMIAAGFLGTMTPLLSWGIVKGAMAFTEFISAGVGSAFASQAGAAAATGNLSMNNMSLDNTSMNKFSTTMSSQVGAQAVQASFGAGKSLASWEAGGSTASANGSPVNRSKQLADQLSSSIAEQKQISEALNQMASGQVSENTVRDWAAKKEGSSAQQKAAQAVMQLTESYSKSEGVGSQVGDSTAKGVAERAGAQHQTGTQASAGMKGGLGLDVGVAKVGGSIDQSMNASETNSKAREVSDGRTTQQGVNADHKTGSSTGAGKTSSFGTTNTSSLSASSGEGAGGSQQTAYQRAVSESLGRSQAITEQLQRAQSVTATASFNEGTNLDTFAQDIASFTSMQNQMGSSISDIQARGEALNAGLSAAASGTRSDIAAATGANGAAYQGYRSGAGAYGAGGGGAVTTGFGNFKGQAQKDIAAGNADLAARVAANAGTAATGMRNGPDLSAGVNPTRLQGTMAPGQLTNPNAPRPESPVDKVSNGMSWVADKLK